MTWPLRGERNGYGFLSWLRQRNSRNGTHVSALWCAAGYSINRRSKAQRWQAHGLGITLDVGFLDDYLGFYNRSFRRHFTSGCVAINYRFYISYKHYDFIVAVDSSCDLRKITRNSKATSAKSEIIPIGSPLRCRYGDSLLNALNANGR